MEVIQTKIPGLFIIEPKVFEDSRGYFFESYNLGKCQAEGLTNSFVQDNESKSKYGVVRGLHYQLNPYSQTKLVRVISGIVYDVAVDLRKGSPTFGQWLGVELSGENKRQLLIPKGFAHGFSVLSNEVVFTYKCDNFYSKEHERAIKFNDPSLGVDWNVPAEAQVASEKDSLAPGFKNAEMNFTFE